MRLGKTFHRLLFAWVLIALSSASFSFAQPDTWVRNFGSVVDDYPEDLLVDNAGNLYVVGFFRDTMEIGGQQLISAGQNDAFLAKFDPDGNLLWADRYGWFENELAHAIAFDVLGNIILVGEYQDSTLLNGDTLFSEDTLWFGPYAHTYEAFWMRIQPDGQIQKVWDGGWFGSENFYDVVVSQSTNKYFISGMYRTYNNWALNGAPWQDGHGRGYDDAIWIRVDSSSTIEYRGVVKGTFVDKGWAVGLIGDTTVVMGGTFQDTCYFIDSVYYELGDFNDDVFVSAYQDTGSFKWVTIGSSKGIDQLNALVTDASGNIYFGGGFDSLFTMGGSTMQGAKNLDGYVGKLDSDGNVLWLKAIGGDGFDMVDDVNFASNGDLLVTGFFQRSIDFGNGVSLELSDTINQNAFVLRMSAANGNVIWAKSLGGSAEDRGLSVVGTPDGHIAALGIFYGTGRFGQVSATSLGGSDAYLLKMNSDGAVNSQDAKLDILGLAAFPNPAKDHLTIRYKLESPAAAQLQVFDLAGKLVEEKMLGRQSGEVETELDLEGLINGLYILRLSTAKGLQSLKFSVQK